MASTLLARRRWLQVIIYAGRLKGASTITTFDECMHVVYLKGTPHNHHHTWAKNWTYDAICIKSTSSPALICTEEEREVGNLIVQEGCRCCYGLAFCRTLFFREKSWWKHEKSLYTAFHISAHGIFMPSVYSGPRHIAVVSIKMMHWACAFPEKWWWWKNFPIFSKCHLPRRSLLLTPLQSPFCCSYSICAECLLFARC